MTLELFRIHGKVRGISLKRNRRVVLGLMFAIGRDIREASDPAMHYCDLCGDSAIAFCQRHARFLCEGCLAFHQDVIRQAHGSTVRCHYLSMEAYRKEPLGKFKPMDRESAS